jgi:uncharacterized protein involved in exopolysaccharide biosynthesis
MNNSQLTLTQIAGAIARNKFKCFTVFLTVFLLVIAAFLVWPKKYGSEGKIHVQLGRNDTDISPTSGAPQQQGVSIQDTRETEIKSVEEILKSRAVLEAAVRSVGPEEVLKNPFDGYLPSLTVPSFLKGSEASADMSPAEYKKLKRIEQAANLLEKSLTVHNQKKTSVISVYVKSNSPSLAQKLVSEIINETRRIHSKMHAVTGSSEFFQTHIADAEKNLELAMTELENYRSERSILSVGAARGTLQDIISDLEKNAVNTSVEVAQTQKTIDNLKAELAKTPAKIQLLTSGVERKFGDDANTEIFRLKNERQRLLASLRPNHPDVQKIESQLRKMLAELDNVEDDRTQSTTAINVVFDQIKIELIRAETAHAGAKARLKNLEKQLTDSRKQILDLNRAEIEVDRLQREIDNLRQCREMYVSKGREASANQSIDQSSLSSLVIAQSPTMILKKVSPKGKLFLPIGVILGMLASLATVLFFERNHLSASLNESEVEQILGMPILVTLPRVYSSRNMVN